MSDESIDVRTVLAASRQTRVEIGRDGVLHVLAGPITLLVPPLATGPGAGSELGTVSPAGDPAPAGTAQAAPTQTPSVPASGQ